MEVSPLNSDTVFVVMVDGLMDFENVSTTWVLSPTLVAPFAGEMVTVGGVLSTVLAVVKVTHCYKQRCPPRRLVRRHTCPSAYWLGMG